jgi:hypothetical protein
MDDPHGRLIRESALAHRQLIPLSDHANPLLKPTFGVVLIVGEG